MHTFIYVKFYSNFIQRSKEYAEAENIFSFIKTIKRLVSRYFFDGTLSNRQS